MRVRVSSPFQIAHGSSRLTIRSSIHRSTPNEPRRCFHSWIVALANTYLAAAAKIATSIAPSPSRVVSRSRCGSEPRWPRSAPQHSAAIAM